MAVKAVSRQARLALSGGSTPDLYCNGKFFLFGQRKYLFGYTQATNCGQGLLTVDDWPVTAGPENRP